MAASGRSQGRAVENAAVSWEEMERGGTVWVARMGGGEGRGGSRGKQAEVFNSNTFFKTPKTPAHDVTEGQREGAERCGPRVLRELRAHLDVRSKKQECKK